MPEVSAQEVMASQGTRLSEKAPWETYGDELKVQTNSQLEAEIEQYAQNRYEDNSSSQTKEELHRQREMNEDVAKQYQFINPEEYRDEGPRVGRVLSYDQFIGILREKCRVKCWYREHPQPDKVTLVYSDEFAMATPQVGCWVQRGQMPEFSFVRFDDHGVPVNEKRRGWRTCILQLILKGVLSEETAHKAFGPARGPAAERYNRTLYEFKKRDQEKWEEA